MLPGKHHFIVQIHIPLQRSGMLLASVHPLRLFGLVDNSKPDNGARGVGTPFLIISFIDYSHIRLITLHDSLLFPLTFTVINL